ncbi:ABC transporter permease subunit [Leifsonia sp. H3M29-4]|uniref:ABC transporter permease n=1 Tax=Salinibacterium metalliresistens TaxID=3031321 RepID=UPI0023DB6C37|nr:ABC transporter permease subunit [Salinibacterium metalliresistens]MDF1477983.1 ABC transporter permease subunit [Salinibacterium metalliresistens]
MPRSARLRRDWVLLALAVPGIALLLLFQYVPLLANVIAFQDYQPYIGIWSSPFVGFQNFEILFNGDPAFVRALLNTLLISFVQIVVIFPLPIALALTLNTLLHDTVKKVVQTVLYLPHFMSWVIVVAIFQNVLGNGGLLNTWLRSIGAEGFDIVGNPDMFLALITSQAAWKDVGWASILFLAALSRIDPNLYEAADMDGANRWQQTWHVTLPGIKGIIVLLLILRLGDVLTVGFEQIVLQQQSVGREVSEVLDTYVYNNGIINGEWGTAAAVGLVKGVVSVVLVLGANKLAHLFGERGVYQS